jgi:thioredoxin-like negative regulator of GroEL
VNSLVVIALFSAAVGASDGETYQDAHQATMKTGKPMLVMVSTEWCAPCQYMKKEIIPQVRERGMLSRVSFAMVNPDHDQELAHQLIGSGPVPELIMFRKTPRGWVRRVLIGGQSVEGVEQFIKEGIAAGEDEAKQDDSVEKSNATKEDPKPKPAEVAK